MWLINIFHGIPAIQQPRSITDNHKFREASGNGLNRGPPAFQPSALLLDQKFAQEKLKFASLIISPGTVTIEWSLIMKVLSVPLDSLQSTMRFDHVLQYGRSFHSRRGAPKVCLHLSHTFFFPLSLFFFFLH